MQRLFFTLDVFTSRRFAGNPLAVVLEAEGLDMAAMQAIANEFNLPETVFVLPPEKAANRARCRIFTPKRELPFAGHPTVGTAVLLAVLDGGGARELALEQNIGLVRCRANVGKGGGEASFAVPVLPSPTVAPPSADAIAAMLGLSVDDIGCGDLTPGGWSAGNPFLFVPVRGIDAVRRAAPDLSRFAAAQPEHRAVFMFARETEEKGHAFHARMFAPAMGIIEDPATGSAAAAFAGLLGRSGGYGEGSRDVAIEQGYEMGRPSLIRLGFTLAAGQLTAVTVGGGAVIVAEGRIDA